MFIPCIIDKKIRNTEPIKITILPYILSCVVDWIYLTLQFKHTTGMAHLKENNTHS